MKIAMMVQGIGWQYPGSSGSLAHPIEANGTITFRLTWRPKNDDSVADPPPSSVVLTYRRTLQAHGKRLLSNGLTSTAKVQTYALINSDDTTVVQADTGIQTMTLAPSNGVATAAFPVRDQMLLSVNGMYPDHDALSGVFADSRIDIALPGFQLPRGLESTSGNLPVAIRDPSFTRWLPLSFSPQINTQPFRTQSGALPAPWGNINCYYSIRFNTEPTPPNYDLPGQSLLYLPGGSSYLALPGPFLPAYVITDANGDRLLFDANRIAYSDVFSTLTYNAATGVYGLTNAGPPGAMKQKGRYTYAFSGSNLATLSDDLGNQQSCAWSPNDPFLTVGDNSSGRSLIFHRQGQTGYITAVDAPGPQGSIYTHTVLAYDATGHLTSSKVYDSTGLILLHQDTFTYGGANGDAVLTTTQGVSQASYTYTTDNYLLDPFSLATNRIASVTSGASNDTSSSDDGASITATTLFSWGPTSQGYNNWGVDARTNRVTDARGNVFSSIFALTGGTYGPINAMTYKGPDYAGAPLNSNTTRLAYSPDRIKPSSITLYDPLYNAGLVSQPWQIALNGTGRLQSTLDPLGHVWQFGYSANGTELTAVTDPTNLTWNFHYGENGAPASRLTSVLDPNGTTRATQTYNAYGQPLITTVPAAIAASGANEQLTFSFHATTGDLTGVVNPLGDQMQIPAYDALGDPLSFSVYPDTGNPATSLHPLTTSIVYDAAQHPIQITAPDGVSLLAAYSNSLITQFKTVYQQNTLAQLNLSVDTRGRLYAASDLVGSVGQRRYDKNSNPTQRWDGKGNVTRFTFGKNNEPTSVLWPDNHSASLAYDAGGGINQATDERGIVTNFLFYADDRLKDIQFPSASTQNVHFTYDAAGRILNVSDSTGSRTYVYDPNLKRLQSFVTVLSALPSGHNTFTVSYAYYGDGKIAAITTPAGTSFLSYNAAGALVSLTDLAGNVTTWIRDHVGRITRQQTQTITGTPIASDYTCGNLLQGTPATHLNSIVHSVSGQPFWSYALSRTPLGQIGSQQGNGSQPNQSESETFSYDLRGRLTGDSDHYQTSASSVFNSANLYSFDLANNLQGGAGGWTYNSSNQATSAAAIIGVPALSGGSGLSYDASGNLASMNGSSLSYDVWGHLAGITATGQPAISYAYDSSGHRVSKTVGGVTTFFLYSGQALIAELDSGGNVTRSYTWGPLGLISDRSGSISRFYLFDGIGNTRFLLDTNGGVLSDAAYTAWGSPNSFSYPSTPYGYKGQWGAYRDSESGLLLMGARYYAPALGRFLSRDPSGFSAGPNLYAFCGGDPVNHFDPDGCGYLDNEWFTRFINFIRPLDFYILPPIPHVFPGIQFCLPVSMLVGLHDSWAHFGSVCGNTKSQPWQMWLAGTNAGIQLVGTAMAFAAPVNEIAGLEGAEVGAGCLERGECFVAGTPVQTVSLKKGKEFAKAKVIVKPIEKVKAGDWVLSRNEKTGRTEIKRVVQPTLSHAKVVLTIALADAKTHKVVETLTSNRLHPFFVAGKGFVPAGGLAVGNAIVTRAGPPLIVASIKWNRRSQGYTVYNLVVEDDHTYFVGTRNGGVWAHNPQLCMFEEEFPPRQGPAEPFDREKHYGYTPTLDLLPDKFLVVLCLLVAC